MKTRNWRRAENTLTRNHLRNPPETQTWKTHNHQPRKFRDVHLHEHENPEKMITQEKKYMHFLPRSEIGEEKITL